MSEKKSTVGRNGILCAMFFFVLFSYIDRFALGLVSVSQFVSESLSVYFVYNRNITKYVRTDRFVFVYVRTCAFGHCHIHSIIFDWNIHWPTIISLLTIVELFALEIYFKSDRKTKKINSI